MQVMKKALVIYYSQTGQLKKIIDSVTAPLAGEFRFDYEELEPVDPFPFPWNGMPFFQAFPESVQEIPCVLRPFRFDPRERYDLIILGVQVWYLSPSIPVNSFLQSQEAATVMMGTPVITIQGVRNMWARSLDSIRERIRKNGGLHCGNIVLADPAPNLVSVITIVRWMMKGQRQGTGWIGRLLPPAGVRDRDIADARRFGRAIAETFQEGSLAGLQQRLAVEGAVKVSPILVTIEKRGYAMFRIWARFVRNKGPFNDPAREKRLRLFKYYLFAVIYLVSPIGTLAIGLFHLLMPGRARKIKEYYSGMAKSAIK